MSDVLLLAFEIAQLKVTSAIIESIAILSTNESESGMEKHWFTVAAKYIDPNGWMEGWINSQIHK